MTTFLNNSEAVFISTILHSHISSYISHIHLKQTPTLKDSSQPFEYHLFHFETTTNSSFRPPYHPTTTISTLNHTHFFIKKIQSYPSNYLKTPSQHLNHPNHHLSPQTTSTYFPTSNHFLHKQSPATSPNQSPQTSHHLNHHLK